MNRDFKGIWIPKEIWLNEELTMLEKVIFVEIDSLDNENHCIASNQYFAEFCNCSESKVSKSIKKLKELGMIEEVTFDGRHRKIRVVKNNIQDSKKYYADQQKVQANNIDNKTNNNKTNSKELVEENSSNNSNDKFLGSSKKKSKGKNLYSKCIDMINDYTEDSEVRKLLVTYLGMRLEMKDKHLYSNQWKGLLNKLTQLVDEGNNICDVIQQSINRGYAGFFPVSNRGNSNIQNAPCEQGVVSQKETEQEKRYNEECAKRREANGQQVYF